MKRVLCLFSLAVFATAGTLTAGVLVFEDATFLPGTSAIPGALALWGGCATTTCTSTTDIVEFNTLLAGGGWGLVIYAEQNSNTFHTDPNSQNPTNGQALTDYVNGGGKLIGQSFDLGGLDTLLQGVGDSGFLTVCGPATTCTITTDSNPVFAGLGPTIDIIDAGWAVNAMGRNPIPASGAVGIGVLVNGDTLSFGIIVGNNGRTYLNAPMTDAYAGTDGERLLANEIGILLPVSEPVPEPATFLGLGLGLAVLAIRKRRA